MAEFLLMRHAKSKHPPGLSDRDRPLSDRGIRSARAIGEELTRIDAVPDRILASPAVRAHETARLAREAGGWTAKIELEDDLYSGGVRALLACLADRGGRVLAVGHEPTWSSAVATLIGGGSVRMVTGAVACVEAPARPGPASGELRWMLQPRLFTR